MRFRQCFARVHKKFIISQVVCNVRYWTQQLRCDRTKYAKHVEVHWSWIAFAISCFELNIRSLKTWTLEERSQYLENQGIVTAKQECSMPFPDWVVFCMLLLCCVSHFAGWNSFTRTKRYWHFCQNFWWNALCPLHGSFVEMSRMLSSSGIRTQMKLPGCLDRSLTRSTENTRK